jgi:hypothetical protein
MGGFLLAKSKSRFMFFSDCAIHLESNMPDLLYLYENSVLALKAFSSIMVVLPLPGNPNSKNELRRRWLPSEGKMILETLLESIQPSKLML